MLEAIANVHDVHLVSNYHYIQKCVFCVLHDCYTLSFGHLKSLDSSALKHSETSFESFFKIIDNYCGIFEGQQSPLLFQTLHHLGDTGLQEDTHCAAKTVSHTVLALSPSSPKVSVPPGKPNKFLKINQEVFRLFISPRYTKMLRNPNGQFL